MHVHHRVSGLISTWAATALFISLLLSGCGGGNGGSVTEIPGGSVPRSTRALLVGSNSNTNAVQLSQSLKSGGYEVDFAPSIPIDVSPYKAVIIDESANISQGSAATVKALLDAGQGVVLLGAVPAILATGDQTLPADTTSISLWFGGVTELQQKRTTWEFKVHNNNLVNLPAEMSDNMVVYHPTTPEFESRSISIVPDDKIGANTAQVLTDFNSVAAFAYRPASGGRLYWQWSGLGTNSDYFDEVRAVLLTGTRWAAGLQ